mmetsp:Transcript_75979/g.167676  ORF Transcript_75979/g.167676 Transcript_75979/m.167676 type:complete len:306 (-) Transcript_75979:36-953(-)
MDFVQSSCNLHQFASISFMFPRFSEVFVIIHRDIGSPGQIQLSLPPLHAAGCTRSLGQRRLLGSEPQLRVVEEPPGQPQERHLNVQSILHAQVVVLDLQLSHHHGAFLCLDHSLWEVHFVSHHNDGDLPRDFAQVRHPLRDVPVTFSIRDVKENNGTLGAYEVSVAETSQVFLPSAVPHREEQGALACGDLELLHFTALCGLVPLDKFASKMSLHEASLAHIAVAQKKQLELRAAHVELLWTLGSCPLTSDMFPLLVLGSRWLTRSANCCRTLTLQGLPLGRWLRARRVAGLAGRPLGRKETPNP